MIIQFNGKEVDEPSNLRNTVANTPPGKEVAMKILRDGKQETVKATIGEVPAEAQKPAGKFDNSLKGVHVQNITPEIRKSLKLPKKVVGVVISDIEEGSPAEGVLEKGDVVLEVNRKRIQSMRDYDAVVSKIRSEQSILVLVYRNGSTIYLTLSVR